MERGDHTDAIGKSLEQFQRQLIEAVLASSDVENSESRARIKSPVVSGRPLIGVDVARGFLPDFGNAK
jgi:hypothetical protein